MNIHRISFSKVKEEVRVVTSEVEAGQGILDHAWVELEYGGTACNRTLPTFLASSALTSSRG